MSALTEDLDLKAALLAVKTEGATYVPLALDGAFGKRLQHEIESGPFAPVPQHVGDVAQEADSFLARGTSIGAFPLVHELLQDLSVTVKRDGKGIKGLAGWKPNLVTVQRFKPGMLGITPHLDSKRFTKLVAIFTTKGSAPFTLCRNRRGEIVARWRVRPGSLLLVRAPGFAGLEDGRPFHMVGGPERGERYSLALRMDARSTRR